MHLGVNLDHVATLRQARYAALPDAHNSEPDLLAAASVCERAGAAGITVHLRADRSKLGFKKLSRQREYPDLYRLAPQIITTVEQAVSQATQP